MQGRVHTSLDAVTATGDGVVLEMPRELGEYSCGFQTTVTGTPDAVSITLEGSDDNENFETLDTSESTTGELRFVTATSRYLRANLGTLTAGTDPTVTAKIITF